MDWTQVLKHGNIVGGDLETQKDNDLHRGPITGIEIKEQHLIITTAWMALLLGSPQGARWQKSSDATSHSVDMVIPPALADVGLGRVYLDMPDGSSGVIYLIGDSKLDPAEVEGL